MHKACWKAIRPTYRGPRARAAQAFVGNGGNGLYSGHVRVYRFDEPSSSWVQRGQDIDGEAAGDHSGALVGGICGGENHCKEVEVQGMCTKRAGPLA